jgi:hypothetical protein
MNEEEKTDDGLKMADDSGEKSMVDSPQSIEEPLTTYNLQPTTQMEVHHHPQVEKKSFKEYLLEGLMIFLAVSMGFIAENIREHISENKKANELAESLYQEVYSDSITMQQKMDLRIRKEKQMLYLRNCIQDSSLEHLGSKFGMAMLWTHHIVSIIQFEPQDGILSQLKSSNNFKFYKNAELLSALGKYSVAINRIRKRNEQEYNFVDNFIRKESVKYFDFKWQDKINKDGALSAMQIINLKVLPEFPFELQNKRSFNKAESSGIIAQYLSIFRGTSQLQYQEFINTNHELLQALRTYYHVEKE